MRVIVLAAGHRNIFVSNEIYALIARAKDTSHFLSIMSDLGNKKQLSNSEVATYLAAFGAKNENCEVEVYRLNEAIDDSGKTNKLFDEITSKVMEAEGLIVGSPLHFGNPSSYLLRFWELLSATNDRPLANKIVGHVIAGARRNGGQEAANIFGLFECAQLGAIIVGDGPPYSQSGGVLESRHAEDALKDQEGVQTCLRTGSRIVRALNVLNNGLTDQRETKHIKIAVISDTERASHFALNSIGSHFSSDSRIHVSVVNLDEYSIQRCIGCSTCPIETENPYRCIVDDRMDELEPIVANADGLIVCLESAANRWSSYNWQTFIERSRYLRRDNYRFANKPVMSIHYCRDLFAIPFHVRIIPPCFKHDMLFVGPSLNLNENLLTDLTSVQQFRNTLDYFAQITLSTSIGRDLFPYTTLYKEEARRYV